MISTQSHMPWCHDDNIGQTTAYLRLLLSSPVGPRVPEVLQDSIAAVEAAVTLVAVAVVGTLVSVLTQLGHCMAWHRGGES